MLPSVSTNFPLHRAAQRPPSRASQQSSDPIRPSSRTGPRQSNRPPSSLSSRPLSAASTRPQSRLSQRPSSRHARSSRLMPLCQTLVTQVAGFKADDSDAENFSTSVDFAFSNLESTSLNKGAASVDMNVMERHIQGHCEKSRVKSRDTLAKALDLAYKRLKNKFVDKLDLDAEIKLTHLPDHLQLLIGLACTPDISTLSFAERYLDLAAQPPAQPTAITWHDILKEEPFEGQHWEGVYGLPSGSVKNEAFYSDCDSLHSLSPLDSDDSALDFNEGSISSLDEPALPGFALPVISAPSSELAIEGVDYWTTLLAHRRLLEELRARQYWRSDWSIDPRTLERPFDITDPSTFGPAMQRALFGNSGRPNTTTIDPTVRYIDEEDAVREILIALQGRKNLLLTWKQSSFAPTDQSPMLIHLSAPSQTSIISSLGHTATLIHRLRELTSLILDESLSSISHPPSLSRTDLSPARTTRTIEAFADAVDREIRVFDSWCATREESMCLAQAGSHSQPELVVSLLSTEKAVNDQFGGAFGALFDAVRKVIAYTEAGETDAAWVFPASSPAARTSHLLDALFSAVHHHGEQGDGISAGLLMRLFASSVEPVWAMIGSWLSDGMVVGEGERTLDDEFFIEASSLMVGFHGQRAALFDPGFWDEGYTLRETSRGESDDGHSLIPSFLKHVAGPVLSAGKAKGLLRALHVPQGDEMLLPRWRSFSDLLISEGQDLSGLRRTTMEVDAISVDALSQIVYDELTPHCSAMGLILAKVVTEDCELWAHLSAIEGVYLMRRGDTMSHFCDVLFAKMDSQHLWADFHTLNSAFNDVVQMNTALGNEWIQPSLVRLSYRNRSKESVSKSVRAIDGLAVEYAVPFPLTYIFPPKDLEAYSEIFCFLLQIRRAKTTLEKILVRGEFLGGARLQSELKILYAMRSRLAWFINALLNFITTNVIHTQVHSFRTEFAVAKSLDEMIRLHRAHLGRLQGRCFLQTSTSALHRAILSILDMALNFSDNFVAFAGDTSTHDISRRSISTAGRRHRSRRQRRQSKNVIGFTLPPRDVPESSDSDEYDPSESFVSPPETSFSLAMSSMVSNDDGFFGRIEKMSSDLDHLVRFVRRGVESLSSGSEEAAPTFGVLAFALDDWDS